MHILQLFSKWVHLILICGLSSSNPSQSIEKTFQLTRQDRELLSKQEYDVQVGEDAIVTIICSACSEYF